MKLQIIQWGQKFLVKDKDSGAFLAAGSEWVSGIPDQLRSYVFCETLDHCHVRIANFIKEREHKLSAHEQVVLKEVEL